MHKEQNLSIELNRGWLFCHGDAKRWQRVDHEVCYNTTKAGQEVGDMNVFRNDNPWQRVTLPHDWSTGDASDPSQHPSNGFKPRGTGWYLLDQKLPDYPEDSVVALEFEGVMGECVVYVNGVLAVRNESGYTGFSVDISDYVLPGETATIVLSVDNSRWEGWWYEGAGIYRPVWLKIMPAVHILPKSVFIRANRESDADWHVQVDGGIVNTLQADAAVEVRWTLTDQNGHTALELSANATVSGYASAQVSAEGHVNAPQLWSPDAPNLYVLNTAIRLNGDIIQTETTSFGFREIRWTDHGMFLNDVLTPVNGICCHQDHAGVGIAVTESINRYRIAKLKAMGVNAYRCAHHCPSDSLLRICDELGMLVMAENRHYRTSDEVMAQVDELVRLSRNHPSVFLYSLFNEEPWQAESRGRRMAAKMLRRIRRLDDTRAVTAAMNGGVLTQANASDVLDVAGMNYYIQDYNTYAKRRPGHPMVATENGPLYATRGIYKSDAAAQVYDSYGLNTSWFGQTLQDTLEAVSEAPHVAGQFVWGGFDYRGEPQPFEWPSVFSHWGLTDNCGFEKDTFFMLKSYYNRPEDLMLHLLPHWNWQDGETVRVCAMTNCDEAQLFINGRPLERKKVSRRRAEWQVPFEPGIVAVHAWKGSQCLMDEVRTAGQPARLEVLDAAPEKGFDCSILNVRLLDAEGIPAPCQSTDRPICFNVKKGTLIGTGNGDPNGIQPDVSPAIKTFCGRCQALVRPDEAGQVEVIITGDCMPEVVYKRTR